MAKLSLLAYLPEPLYKLYNKIREKYFMLDFYRYHITFKRKNGKFKITAIKHDDLVDAKYKRIFKYRAKHCYKEFISFSLRQAMNGCNYIIFLIDEEDNRFVQFWTRENILYMDFPMFYTTSLAFYEKQVVKLLKKYGFKKIDDALTPIDEEKTKEGRYYSTNLENRGKSINANFFTNVELATEITIKILNGILDVKPDDVNISMG